MDHARRAARPPAAPRLAAAAAALLVVVAGCTAAPAPGPAAEPAPAYLRGRPLTGLAGLRLLVAGDPPRLLDVDRGTSTPVGGLSGRGPFGLAPLGDGALVTGDREVFVLGRGSTRAKPAGDRDALLDAGSGRVLARYPEVHGVVGDVVLWGEPERHAGPFTLTDRRTGTSRPLARPTPHGRAGMGRPSPDGRLLAVEFADLSWSRVQGQVSDIWLLDLAARRWRRLPGMPLITAVKFMSTAWTDDGRLVLAGDFDRFGEAVAVWRPGQDHLAIRRLDLPEPDGSDGLVAWAAAGD